MKMWLHRRAISREIRRRRQPSPALLAAVLGAMVAVHAWAQPIVYPARGQSTATQNRDQSDCRTWAQNSTGIDPAKLASQPVAQETGPATGGGERVRGAARGAAGGAIIGGIAGDAGQGAAIGAVAGTMAGGRNARRNQDARNSQSQADRQNMMNTYYRAFGACMEGRGYTIK
jgi:outer membrane protein with glycine zipper